MTMNPKDYLDLSLVEKMRDLARAGGDVPAILELIKKHTQPTGTLIFLIYFMGAFDIPLRDAIDLQGAASLGNAAYTNEQINSMLLPLIRKNLGME